MKNGDNHSNWFSKAFLLSSGHFFSDIYPGFLAAVLPLLMTTYGFSISFAGLLAAIASLSGSLLQPIFGFLSDRLSTRFFIIMGPVISGFFYCTVGYLPNKWFIMLWVLFGGLGQAQFHPLAAKMTYGLSERNRSLVMSIFVSGGSIGFSTGPLVITSLIAFRDIYIVPAALIPALVMAFFMYCYSPAHVVEKTSRKKTLMTRSNLKELTAISIFVVIGLLRSFVVLSFNVFIPILFSQRGESLETGGLAIFLFHFIGGLGTLAGGYLADRIDPRKIITGSFLLAVPALVLFLNSTGAIAYISLGLAGCMMLCSIPTVITQAQATLPGHMSTVSSMVMGVSWGAGGLLVSVAGRAADIFGLELTMQVLAYFPLIGVLITLPLHYRAVKETRYPDYI